MQNSTAMSSANQIIIPCRPVPRSIRYTLGTLIVICALVPVAALVLAASFGEGLHFGNFIILGVMWLAGYYLLRQLLWNSLGREIISIRGGQLHYIADFKWFRDGEREIPGENIKVEIIEAEEPAGFGRLLFTCDDQVLETVIKQDPAMLKKNLEFLISQLKTNLSS